MSEVTLSKYDYMLISTALESVIIKMENTNEREEKINLKPYSFDEFFIRDTKITFNKIKNLLRSDIN